MKRFVTFVATFVAGIIIIIMIARFIDSKSSDNTAAKQRQNNGPAAVAVEITPLKTGVMVDQGKFMGSIEPTSRFLVAPKISGRIKKLFVDIGDTITNGSVIATLDNEELLLAVKQAEADLEIARANYNESAGLLDISQKELDRVIKMRQQKVSSDAEVESAQATHKTRQAKLQVNKALLSQTEAALDAAKVRLGYATVDASWTEGSNMRFIGERFQNEGSMIGANTSIVSVIDIATVTAAIDVVEKDYFKIKIGQVASIEPAAMPGHSYKARVNRIAPLLNTTSRQARVELELQNVDFSLKPGMFINAKIVYESHDSATIAPTSSLVRRNEKQGLFVVDHEKNIARFVEVKTGFTDNDQIEIVSPKITGDVVTLGQHLLEDGAPLILGENQAQKPATDRKGGKKQ